MTKEELDEILTKHTWIKVKRFDETQLDGFAYLKLLEHHHAETDFLISKYRELAIKYFELEQSLKDEDEL